LKLIASDQNWLKLKQIGGIKTNNKINYWLAKQVHVLKNGKYDDIITCMFINIY